MGKIIYCVFIFLLTSALFGHEGHAAHELGRPTSWLKWVGSFHLILLHFPSALVTLVGVSEALYVWKKSPSFDYCSQFMLMISAIVALPTALLGLMLSYTIHPTGLTALFLKLHMWTGFASAISIIIVFYLRKCYGTSRAYYFFLIFLLLLINITGFLGSGITFGPFHLLFPSNH